MDVIDHLRERGLIAQITHEPELKAKMAEGPLTFYYGVDPTANSMHIGHTVPLMAARILQSYGHRIIVLVGGGTAKIGDPTGKSEMRQMLSDEDIAANVEAIKAQLSQLIDLSDPAKGIMVNNADWLESINYLPFLRDIGVCFSINRMLTFESVKQRLEKGLSFLEFNYMILQGYDFYQLYLREKCVLQIGGDDQWSNMLNGMELVRRKSADQAFALTTPLLTNSQGKKMGKTEKGAVWIDPAKTSPYDMFQFFRNIDDDMVETCLLIFTDVAKAEVDRLSGLEGNAINEAKIVLAYEAVKMLHGDKAADEARTTAKNLFEQAGGDAPIKTIASADLGEGRTIVDVLVLAGVAASKSEARRLVQGGGIRVNREKIEDLATELAPANFQESGEVLLQKGKKHFFRLTLS